MTDTPTAATRPTTVLDVSRLTRRQRAAREADPSFVYVGRAFAGWPASVYGNPFRPGMSARDAWAVIARATNGNRIVIHADVSGPLTPAQAVACYRACWAATPVRREKIRRELKGKALGCWCCDWDGAGDPGRPCHAVELARIAESVEEPGR